MLEVKNLTKVYSTKGGVTVRALDDVSVVFPEKGMVFLLGRSGSGKSTLLNVAGGLDKPDGGEVIVKGKSSKDFSGSDFDSYRNTFIGFVFQEYNILNEFTIEQNISLALQLQSKPNDKAAVAALLEQVDLAGYAKRKPNTLSGGQKQRVAIARALIKEPEIIMADEPTGALDSATGKQVFDTLKKLSEKKLVIVVSHDREFAEQYGDRIIELKDGKIISDVTKIYNAPKDMTGEATEEIPNVAMVSEDTIAIRNGEELTDDDIKKIASLLRKKGGEAIITTDEHDLPGVKRACKINEKGDKESFKETVPPTPVAYDGSKTKFIKSRLPMGHAIKMGASGLKSKPIRLIFTILLAVAAFILFGVVSTFMLYDPDYSVSEALKEVNYPNILLDKHYTYVRNSYRVDNVTGEEKLDYSDEGKNLTLFSPSEVKAKSVSGLNFAGVYTFNNSTYDNKSNFSLAVIKGEEPKQIAVKRELEDYYVVRDCTGFSDCGKAYLVSNGFVVTGSYPTKSDEIMLPMYLAECFANTEGSGVTNAADMIGKKIKFSGYGMDYTAFTVTGLVKTGDIPTKYDELKRSNTLNEKDREALQQALKDYLSHGFETLIYVSDDFYDEVSKRVQQYNNNGPYINSKYVRKIRLERYYIDDTNVDGWGMNVFTEKIIEKNKALLTIRALDGSVKTDLSLRDDEVLVSESKYNEIFNDYLNNHYFNPIYDPEAYEELYGATDGSDGGKYGLDSADRETKVAAAKKWYSVLAFREGLYNLANGYLYWNLSNSLQYWDLYDNEKNFVLGFENKTESSDLVALEAYVAANEQVYYGILMERMMNSHGWEYIFGEEDPYTVNANLKNAAYTASEFSSKKAALDDWFSKNGISTAVADHFTFDSKSADAWNAVFYVMPTADKAFLSLMDKIRAYVEGGYEKSGAEAVAAPTTADWDALYAYVKTNHPQTYYGWLVEYLNNNNPNNRYRESDKESWSIVDDLKYGNYSDEDFEALKGRLATWIASLGASTEAKDNYKFNVDDAVKDLNYCDKYGTRGTLKVVGYVENMNAEYCVTESFLDSHAEMDKEGSYWYDTYETDYVVPADARYNKIISLTDNSLSQISAAQSGVDSVLYRINNDVVEKLNYFLDMITDLEKIFLYVGLGVGVLAAFFLLNFISVSISTKRKDIGILRAVGARGSDVFKIFYAESFIIAFICFVLASIGSYVLCLFLNRELELDSVTLNLLHFGPINIALVFGISIFVSVIATFLPVYFAARKSPVDSIRAL